MLSKNLEIVLKISHCITFKYSLHACIYHNDKLNHTRDCDKCH